MATPERKLPVDCVAYDPAPIILFDTHAVSETEESVALNSALGSFCFHPDLIADGAKGAYCGEFWLGETCSLRVPKDSPKAAELEQRIKENQEAKAPQTFEDIF